jgi:phosphoglycolate phosphatase
MKHQAILFDLDGTLLDTLTDLAICMNSVLMRHGFPTHLPEKYKHFVGDGVERLVWRAVPEEHRDPTMLEKCLAGMLEEYGRRWMENTGPYPGVPALLDALTERKIKMSIFSNKNDEFTQLTVQKFLAKWRFELVVGARPSVPKKPDPTTPLAIARQLGIAPSDFLYVGDTDTDMKTATAAGMHAVGALWGFRGAEELLRSGAQVLVEKPADILQLL